MLILSNLFVWPCIKHFAGWDLEKPSKCILSFKIRFLFLILGHVTWWSKIDKTNSLQSYQFQYKRSWKLQIAIEIWKFFSFRCNLQAKLWTDNQSIFNCSIEFRKQGIQVQPQLRNCYQNIFLHRILSLFSEAFPKLFRTMVLCWQLNRTLNFRQRRTRTDQAMLGMLLAQCWWRFLMLVTGMRPF